MLSSLKTDIRITYELEQMFYSNGVEPDIQRKIKNWRYFSNLLREKEGLLK